MFTKHLIKLHDYSKGTNAANNFGNTQTKQNAQMGGKYTDLLESCLAPALRALGSL